MANPCTHAQTQAFSKANQRRDRDYQLADVVSAVCRRYEITLEQLKTPGKARPYSEARSVISLLALELPGLCLTELGKMLNRDISSLGRAGRRLLEESIEDEGLSARIDELRLELSECQKVKPDRGGLFHPVICILRQADSTR